VSAVTDPSKAAGPAGLWGLEFVEFASPDPARLHTLFTGVFPILLTVAGAPGSA